MDDILSATKNSINTIFPLKRVTRKQAELIQNPWLSDDIIKESKLRDKLQMTAVKSGLLLDQSNYRKQRNKVNRMCRNAKRKHLNNDCEKNKGDSKGMWDVINRATNKKPKGTTYPNFIESTTTDGEIKKTKPK